MKKSNIQREIFSQDKADQTQTYFVYFKSGPTQYCGKDPLKIDVFPF